MNVIAIHDLRFCLRAPRAFRRALAQGGLVSLALLVSGGVTSVTPALAAGDANQSSCPFETEDSPGFRTYLPDCRAFELVTPPYKEGGIVIQEPSGAISEDGSHVIVGIAGAFGGADNYLEDPIRNPSNDMYEFTRGAGGWQSTELTPPAGEYSQSALMAVSADNFGETLWGAERANPLYPDVIHHEDIYLRTGSGASEFHPVGPGTPRNGDGKEVLEGDKLSTSEELNLVGASRDLTRSLYQIVAASSETPRNLWEGDTTDPERPSLYEYVYTGSEDPEPTLVGVRNEGHLHGSPHLNEGAELISDCGTELGAGESGSAYNAVSASGEVVFFTALECEGRPAVSELYARIAGASTVDISEPSKGDCEACKTTERGNATFAGASQNGEKVFFSTEQELLPGQTGNNLYEYDFKGPEASAGHPDGKISLVSAGSTKPTVQGVVRVSEDGERVYFVAEGKLSGPDTVIGRNPEQTGPKEEAYNLYVYEPELEHPGSYHTVFIATLFGSSEEATLRSEENAERAKVSELAEAAGTRAKEEALSRGVEEPEASEIGRIAESQRESALGGTLGPSGTRFTDKSVWSGSENTRTAQATRDGRFLVFLSSADLTKGDTSKTPQLFEYDAGDEALTRVSIGQGGVSSGNVETFAEAPNIPNQLFRGVDLPTAADTGLALTEDGSSVFFTSAAPLAPQAQPNTTNVYEYRAGDVYLLSGGNASSHTGALAVTLFGADPVGQNVFFTTDEQLLPQDGETERALYDAREGGGFPAPALQAGCFGETCRGTSSPIPESQTPGSATQVGGGNLALPASMTKTMKPKSLSDARKLATALKACRAKDNRRKRAVCQRRARKSYGVAATVRRSSVIRRRGK